MNRIFFINNIPAYHHDNALNGIVIKKGVTAIEVTPVIYAIHIQPVQAEIRLLT